MALAGVRVLELEGLGPAPLASCVLADFGADVVTIVRVVNGSPVSQADPVSRGKRSIAVDLKKPEGVEVVLRLASHADVFIEPFRPGVAEKLGLGPDILQELNPKLIYGRMTGFGQGGTKFQTMAGHDANYLALSGLLGLFRRGNERPFPPVNFAADYAGGGMVLALGVLLALIERARSDRGQVIDAAMVDGANYVALPLFKWFETGFLPRAPNGDFDAAGSVLNQAPHFVEVYECKQDPTKACKKEYMSVQALEPQFYRALLKGLELDGECQLPDQYDRSSWPSMKTRFATIFRSRTRDAWAEVFYGTDACCVPVLSPKEASAHHHNAARGSFAPTPGAKEGVMEPVPAPRLSRTPGHLPRPTPVPGGDTLEVLRSAGFSEGEVQSLQRNGVIVAVRRGVPANVHGSLGTMLSRL